MKIAILFFAATVFVGLGGRTAAKPNKPLKAPSKENPMILQPSGPLEKHGPYRPGGGFKPCFDKKGVSFCQKAQDKGKCPLKKMKKRCRKTCGYCEDQSECQDFGFSCHMATPFTCAQYWFANACKRTCNRCPIVTTTIGTIPTVDPEKECIDTSFNCHLANSYRCALYGFQIGCRKSCRICTPKTTTTLTTTTEATTQEVVTTEATPPATTTTTTVGTVPTSTTTTEAPEIRPTEALTTSTKEIICVDTDPKNCVAWKELGLCFHPQFEEDMKTTCPLSCDACSQ